MNRIIPLTAVIAIALASASRARPPATGDTVSRRVRTAQAGAGSVAQGAGRTQRQRAADQAAAATKPAAGAAYATQEDLNDVDATLREIKKDIEHSTPELPISSSAVTWRSALLRQTFPLNL